MLDLESDIEIINHSSLIDIDHLLQSLSSCKLSEAPKLLLLLSEAILVYLSKAFPTDAVSDLFDQSLSHNERRFVAICLLRFLAGNSQYFESNRDFRIRAFALFDDVLSKDLYPMLDINPRQQTYEKSIRLKDAAPIAESKMSEIVNSLISLEAIDEYLSQLMKILSNTLVRAVVLPFLPRALIYKARIKEIFDSVKDYRKAAGSNTIQAFERAKDIIRQYISEAEEINTLYCRHYLIAAAEKLIQIIQDDFANSEAGQPAQLIIKPLDKKYPFRQIGHDLELSFTIENMGPGHAFDVRLNVTSSFENIQLKRSSLAIGQLEPGVFIADFPARVLTPEEIAILEVSLDWANADESNKEISSEFELKSQRIDIPWSELEFKDPYSIEPVETYDQLVGRKELIRQLLRYSCAKSLGSSYVFGQKRVGKTSIAKALKSRLAEENGFYPIYIEGGEYVNRDPEVTLARLGLKLCEKIRSSDKRFSHLSIPSFEGAFSPLTDFLKEVIDLSPEVRILFILDEFDELPIELYRRGPLADAFFLTLRTISGMPPFGFVLVGSEKIEFIMSCQGDALNKFQAIRVDEFNKDTHWSDFIELVRKPTKEWLEISDNAIIELYDQTAGNPFYTMFICRELFNIMVERRDCYVTEREIKQATKFALQKIKSNGFQHFWEDGIFESSGDRVEEISMRRRRILIAFANVLRIHKTATKDLISKEDIVQEDLNYLESELHRFVQRKVFIQENEQYDCNLLFFHKWLVNTGVIEILTTFSDLNSILERRQREENNYVHSGEIVDLLSNWGLYRGRRITEDQIRAWLDQFGEYSNQKLMFKILTGLRFFSEDQIREKMKEAHGIVRRGTVWKIEEGKRKRSDIVISYLDGPGKSGGGKYAKLYADENGIYFENVIERNKLAACISSNQHDFQALVFVDDFIGTGDSAKNYFRNLGKDLGDLLQTTTLKIFFIAMTGFGESIKSIEKTLNEYKLPIKIHICEPVDSSIKCFSDNSIIFPEQQERITALRLAQEYGAKIVKKNSLGYGDCQTAIVFSDSCPNNNLPILWAESTEPSWRPLFRRG